MNCKDTQNLIQPNNAYHRFADRKVLNLLRYLIGQWFFKLMRDWNTFIDFKIRVSQHLIGREKMNFHQYSERSPGVLGIRPSGPSLVGGNCQNKEECLCARWDRRGRSRKQCGQETKETFFQSTNGELFTSIILLLIFLGLNHPFLPLKLHGYESCKSN